MKKIFFLMLSLFVFNQTQAQKNITLSITHKLGANNFAFNTTAQNDLVQNFQITRVDYYISGIEIIHDGGVVTPILKYILVKGSSNVTELLGNVNVTNLEGIKFSIGVDSPVNNQDPTQKFGALALQSPSMHWGWASGYRFVALEGKAGDNFATGFELHGLWNANYFQQTIMTSGVTEGDNITINLDADYTQALKGIDVAAGPLQHGDNLKDLDMLKNFRDHVFKPSSAPTGIADIAADNSIRIYPNPNKGKIHIDLSKSANTISSYKITDINGRFISSGNVANGAISLQKYISGNYVLTLFNKEHPVYTQMVTFE